MECTRAHSPEPKVQPVTACCSHHARRVRAYSCSSASSPPRPLPATPLPNRRARSLRATTPRAAAFANDAPAARRCSQRSLLTPLPLVLSPPSSAACCWLCALAPAALGLLPLVLAVSSKSSSLPSHSSSSSSSADAAAACAGLPPRAPLLPALRAGPVLVLVVLLLPAPPPLLPATALLAVLGGVRVDGVWRRVGCLPALISSMSASICSGFSFCACRRGREPGARAGADAGVCVLTPVHARLY